MADGDILAGLPEGLRHEVEDFAKATQRPYTLIVTEALEAYMEDQRAYQAAIEEAEREIERGETVDGDEVIEWLKSWGKPDELPPPSLRKTQL